MAMCGISEDDASTGNPTGWESMVLSLKAPPFCSKTPLNEALSPLNVQHTC